MIRRRPLRLSALLVASTLGAPWLMGLALNERPAVIEPTTSLAADWSAVLSEPQGEWPEPLESLQWRDDLAAAMAEAQESGRPLLVTARCLPCKQCATFDKEVLDGGPVLTPLMSRFITVRLTDSLAFDRRLMPYESFQDLDVSWWAYMIAPDGRLYGIFGGKDEVSDATRISKAAFANTLRRVLDHHSDPRRAKWDVDGDAPDMTGDAEGPRDEPGFESWTAKSPDAPDFDLEPSACVHCHQLAEVLRQPAIDDGTFDKVTGLGIWPYPENVGITLDRDDGLLVTAVEPKSAAARAGVRAGDSLAAAGGRRLFGQCDLRGVLHRSANPSGAIDLVWRRGDDVHEGTLELAKGWRATALHWRNSVSQGNVAPGPGFPFPLAGPPRGGKMSVRPFFGRAQRGSLAFAAGLRPSHTIIAVNGKSPNVAGREFLTWFRLNHEVGDTVRYDVLEGGRQRTIEFELGRY